MSGMNHPFSYTAGSMIKGFGELITAAEERRVRDAEEAHGQSHSSNVWAFWTGYISALNDMRNSTTDHAFQHVVTTAMTTEYDTEEN